MKRLVAGMLAGVLAVGMMLSGCSKQLTPEEQAASDAAVLAQQLQDEEDIIRSIKLDPKRSGFFVAKTCELATISIAMVVTL